MTGVDTYDLPVYLGSSSIAPRCPASAATWFQWYQPHFTSDYQGMTTLSCWYRFPGTHCCLQPVFDSPFDSDGAACIRDCQNNQFLFHSDNSFPSQSEI